MERWSVICPPVLVCSRFGSLLEIHLIPGRKVGYVKYADKQVTPTSASSASEESRSHTFDDSVKLCGLLSLPSELISRALRPQCADEAMAALHGRTVNGVKMKVMLADPPREESHKRLRTY